MRSLAPLSAALMRFVNGSNEQKAQHGRAAPPERGAMRHGGDASERAKRLRQRAESQNCGIN